MVTRLTVGMPTLYSHIPKTDNRQFLKWNVAKTTRRNSTG